jgi:hypothetical protein
MKFVILIRSSSDITLKVVYYRYCTCSYTKCIQLENMFCILIISYHNCTYIIEVVNYIKQYLNKNIVYVLSSSITEFHWLFLLRFARN